ncbi:MAG TPA: cell wall-binding repeat-containing protein, partial [Nocardioidaceae bacterium]|nr:cell wall-binding repeat-containing protein [Nocardioidaceae bacterium]
DDAANAPKGAGVGGLALVAGASGTNQTNGKFGVDNVVVNGTTYDFEPFAEPSILPSGGGGGGGAAPTPPPAPEGTTDAESATSTSADGTATATSGETTVTAHGEGAFTVSQYPSNPTEPAPVEGQATFFDVLIAEGSSFTSLTITQCDLPANAHSIVWFNGTKWLKASSVTYADGCATVTITDSTSPNLADLTGTVFAAGKLPVNRLAGPNRIETAVAVSQHRYPADDSAGAVVLARSDEFTDALAGAPLADAHDAPVLLTHSDSLSGATLSEIERVLPDGGTVYLLGGPAALSTSVEQALEDAGFVAKRIAGANRYATAVSIAKQLGSPSTVLEVPGTNFPDAISAGPVAATLDGAILLTRGTKPASATTDYLAAHKGLQRYTIGGISAQADPKAEEVSGTNRYATSAAVAEKFFDSPTTVNLATGLKFPDALTAGPSAGVPVLLVRGTGSKLPETVSTYLTKASSSATTLNVFGGDQAVHQDLVDAAADLLQ